MSDFNYQEYLKNNPLLQEEVKDQLITEAEDKDVEEMKHPQYSTASNKYASRANKPGGVKNSPELEKTLSDFQKRLKAKSAELGLDEEEIQEEVPSSKMKVSELKSKIKETILAELSLAEAKEEVDVDIDVEDEVEVDAEADDIEIEKPGVKTTVDVGLSPEEEVVQDSLKAAMDAANELGNQKLADQIGNTITFFTREFVVGQNTD